MRCNSFDNFFVNFANKTRLSIVLLLQKTPLSVNEISEKLNEEQSKVSHNLKKLYSCKIINFEQQGKQRIYSLNKETVLPMLRLVEKHVNKNCCKECDKK